MPARPPQNPPPPTTPRDAARRIVTTLRDAGHVAYFAGGCVRDRLLGLAPKDYDVATDATPDLVQQLFKHSQNVGAAFGVILVHQPRKHGNNTSGGAGVTEVATFRTDGHYSDGRRPDHVTFTDARHDAQRRDFTINGLFENPLVTAHHTGTETPLPGDDGIIDFVQGRADLQNKIIRAIGDPNQRFAEDYLRMLRAVRFAARLDFTIEANTAEAITRHAPKLERIARERIGDEVRRMITGPRPADAAHMLHQLGLDAAVFGQRADALPTTQLRQLDQDADYPTRLSAWLDARSPAVPPARVRDRLALSNDEHLACQQTSSLFAQRESLPTATVADRKKTFSHPRWPQAMLRIRAQGDPEQIAWLDAQYAHLESDGIGLAPPPLLTGDDLIAAGFTPGPAFKPLLSAVYDAQLQGDLRDRPAALALARNISQSCND